MIGDIKNSAMKDMNQPSNGECCPEFHPEKWDEKTFQWDHKHFIKASIPTFFHIPFPPMIGNKVTKMMKLAEAAQKLADDKEDVLLLFTDPGAFRTELYLSVMDEVPDAENAMLTGTYFSRAFAGDYNAVPKFIRQMEDSLSKQQKKAKNYYVHYAYCPKCAKKAGHNYLVLFAELE